MASYMRSGMRSAIGGAHGNQLGSSVLGAAQMQMTSPFLPPPDARCFDEDGNDVTPLPLLPVSRSVARAHQAVGEVLRSSDSHVGGKSFESVHDAISAIDAWSSQSFGRNGSATQLAGRGGGPGGGGGQDGRSRASSLSLNDSTMGSDSEQGGIEGSGSATSLGDVPEDPSSLAASSTLPANIGRSARPSTPELEKPVDIYLTETPTIQLLDIPCLSVGTEDSAVDAIRRENERYAELLSSRSSGATDTLAHHATQTLSLPIKHRDVQTSAAPTRDQGEQVNWWSVWDETVGNRKEKDKSEGPSESAGHGATAAYLSSHSASTSARRGGGGGGMGHRRSESRSDSRSSSIAASSFALDASRGAWAGGGGASMGAGSDFSSVSVAALPGMGIGGAGAGGEVEGVAERLGVLVGAAGGGAQDPVAGLPQDHLLHSLAVTERAVMGNVFADRFVKFRNLPESDGLFGDAGSRSDGGSGSQGMEGGEIRPTTADTSVSATSPPTAGATSRDQTTGPDLEAFATQIPSLELLWAYRCEATRGRQDILAVAYGPCEHETSAPPGLVACWSPRNPEYPERIYTSNSVVTCLDFSLATPNLLSVGYHDGHLAVYDVRTTQDSPVFDTRRSVGKHRDPVWEVRWVEVSKVAGAVMEGEGAEKGEEMLVSVATDGRVVQWDVRKGGKCTDLMLLKRVYQQTDQATDSTRAGAAAGANTGPAGTTTTTKNSGSATSLVRKMVLCTAARSPTMNNISRATLATPGLYMVCGGTLSYPECFSHVPMIGVSGYGMWKLMERRKL
ncbi:WD repeat-containing protein 78 [Gonapodya sp. JEL0774]|nr:WD repeat-containing protein 78 [Gonapodya sp. JEL0774]